jgi:hypothetical protein
VLVPYQHLPRVHRKLFLYRTFNRLVEQVDSPIPVAISDNQIAFIILTKSKKRQNEVRKALDEYMRSNLAVFD